MLVLLILVLILILGAAYYTSNKEICSPAVLFVAPFVVMCIIAEIFRSEWSWDLHFSTFLVVLCGNFAFCVGTWFGNRIAILKSGTNCSISNEREIKPWKYILLLIFQVLCYGLKVKYIIEFATARGVENNLSKCLGYYNDILKFTTEEAALFPGWLTLGLDVCTMFGFICACVLAQLLLVKRKDKKAMILILLNYFVAFIGGSTSGGRGGSVQIVVALLAAYLILYQRMYGWNREVPLRKILLVSCGLIGIVVLFLMSVTWIGRTEVHMVGRYISNYIGAQIFNLDYFLNSAFEESQIFGQETFYPLIQRFAGWFGVSKWSNYHVGYANVYAAGYNTGNVYTAFYSYVKDMGFVGAIVFPVIFGMFSQIAYKLARKSPSEYPINLGLIFYSNLAYMIAFSFFADKFGSIVFTFNMAKKFVILWLLNYFLFQINLKGTKIVFHGKLIKKNS